MSNAPIVRDEDAGKKAWCSCGESKNQPFCDGSHAGCDNNKVPVVVELDAPKKVAWCGCKKTSNPPYCDGTHTKL